MSVDSMSLTPSSQKATMTIQCDWDVLPTLVANILGFPVASGAAGTAANSGLRRQLPWSFPIFPHLRAVEISNIQGYKPLGKQSYPGGDHNKWSRVKLVVLFEAVPYDVKSEQQIGLGGTMLEYKRYTEKTITPAVEFLQKPGQQYQFINSTTGLTNGTKFGQSVQRRLEKLYITYKWRDVPMGGAGGGIIKTSSQLPENLLSIVGRVNDAAFDGYPTGTLLGLPFKITPTMASCRPDLMGLGATDVPRTADVEINMVYFKPPTEVAYAYAGHNLAPHPTLSTWHLISQDASTSDDKRVYQSVDFAVPWRMHA
jgi:hypothetical protein